MPPTTPNAAEPDAATALAGFFDAAWYAERYPDVAAAGFDPLRHYIEYGAAEGRDPNPWFDSAWYRDYYPGVASSGLPPLVHYLRFGAAALRNPHPHFDASWYVARHPEAAGNPLVHHLRVGQSLGWATEPTSAERSGCGADPPPGSGGRIGIGIITFNRKEQVRETVRCVRQYTLHPNVEFVVADDGSTDGTATMLRQDDVPVVTGVTMGVAWNRNRALWLLAEIRGCDTVILLEDDTRPATFGWERAWIEAACRWGYVAYPDQALACSNATSRGTLEDPFIDRRVTSGCAAFSRAALNWGGYFDSRCRGFGLERIEYSQRLVRVGYSGVIRMTDGIDQPVLSAMLRSGLETQEPASHFERDPIGREGSLTESLADELFRMPWRDLAEMKQFRAEINSAVEARPQQFALRAVPVPRLGLSRLARLFRRRP